MSQHILWQNQAERTSLLQCAIHEHALNHANALESDPTPRVIAGNAIHAALRLTVHVYAHNIVRVVRLVQTGHYATKCGLMVEGSECAVNYLDITRTLDTTAPTVPRMRNKPMIEPM